MTDQPRIGAVRQQRARAALRPTPSLFQNLVTQIVVGALLRRNLGVLVIIGPRLDAGVEIAHAMRLAPFDGRQAADADAEVEHDAAGPDVARQHFDQVIRPDPGLRESDPGVAVRRDGGPVVVGRDHGDARRRHVEMPEQQRQRRMTDRPEADDQDVAVEGNFLCHRRDRPLVSTAGP